MKKRILALALCLLLVVPFVLTSCFTPDKGNEDGDTSLYNELKKMYYDEKEPTKAETLEIEGASGKLEDGFYSASKTTTSLDTLDTTTTYFIYNVATGALVYSYDVVLSVGDGYTSEYTSVVFEHYDNMFVVKKGNGEGNILTSIMSADGTELISGTDVAYKITGNGTLVVFDGKLYVFENNALTFKKSIVGTMLEEFISDLAPLGGKYIYVEPTYNVAVYYDKDFNFLFEKSLVNSAQAYNTVKSDTYYLGNGNLIYQEVYELGAYNPQIDASTYDYLADGICYKVSSFLLDAGTREYKEITLPFVIETVIPFEYLSMISGREGMELPYGAENIAMVKMIDNKKLTYTNGEPNATILLYNDLTYKMSPTIDGTSNISYISENRYIVEGNIISTIYNEKGEAVAKIEEDYSINESYIYTDRAIYNHNFELVYSLEENDAEIYAELSDALVVCKAVEEETVYYLLTPAQSAPVEISRKSPAVYDTFFYTLADEIDGEGNVTGKIVSIFQTNGTLISSYTLYQYSSINVDTIDGYFIIRTTSKEGNTLLIKLS